MKSDINQILKAFVLVSLPVDMKTKLQKKMIYFNATEEEKQKLL